MPRVLLLIPSTSYRATDFMEAAQRLGIEVVVGSDERHPLDELHPGRQVALDFVDVERGTGQVEAFAERFPLDTIVAVDDPGTRLAAAASRRLELPHNPVSAVEATRNKALLRLRLAEAAVPSPSFRIVDTGTDPASVARTLDYPVVLKPLALSASRGVIRANSPNEFEAAFERLRRILADPAIGRECGELADRILVEGYIPGIEVALEGLLTGGELHVLALFDKPDPLEGPFFEETIYVTPSQLASADQRLIAETTARAAAALGLCDGPIHAELRLNETGAFPVDIAARSIGGLCSRTLTFGTGVSLEELILRNAIGSDVSSLARETLAAGVMMIPIPAEGVLKGVEGLAEARVVPLIESVTISARVGGPVTPLPEGGEYLGFIFARGMEPADVESALRNAHALLRFDIEPSVHRVQGEGS
jgi:biotin carboxylase